MFNIEDIDFSQEDEEKIIDQLFNGLMMDVNTKQIEKGIEDIKKESQMIIKLFSEENGRYRRIIELLRARENLSQKIDNYNKMLKSNKELTQNDIDSIKNEIQKWETYKKRYSNLFYKITNWEQYSSNLFKTIMTYQNNLNKLLGQQTEVHFVLYNKGNPLVYKLDLEDDVSINKFLHARYNKDTFTGAFTGVSKKALDELQYSALDNDILYDTSNFLSNTYHNIMYRYNQARKHNSHRIFWKENRNSDYGMIEVGQRGDINEAYALFFLKKKEFIKNNDLEKRIKYYAEEGIMSIDSVPGLLTGDITLSNGRELAIKSAGASMLSFTQVEKIAKKINTEWSNKTPEQFLKALFREKIDVLNLGKKNSIGRNKLKKDISKDILDKINKEAQTSLASYKNYSIKI